MRGVEKVRLGKTGEKIPALGLGTFGMGGRFSPDSTRDSYWVELIRKAVEMGYTLIDTAEIYGGGHTEELIGEAIRGLDRDDLFIISKIAPENARFIDTLRSGLRIAERLGTHVDLLLIHWPPALELLPQMIRAMEKLVEMGIARYIGVSNFSAELTDLAGSLAKREEIVANESELSLVVRGNLPLLEWCRRNNITFIAYSPLGQGDLFRSRIYGKLEKLARDLGKTPVQIALRWILDKGAATLVMSSKEEHLRENLGALGWRLKYEL